jgi:hypothetical protein
VLFVVPARARGYTNLSVCVYFRYQEVHSIPGDLAHFSNQWTDVEKQLKVDKVFLETTRNRELASDPDVGTMKKFFSESGIKTSGGMGLTVQPFGSNRTCAYFVPLCICFPPRIKEVYWCVAVQMQASDEGQKKCAKVRFEPYDGADNSAFRQAWIVTNVVGTHKPSSDYIGEYELTPSVITWGIKYFTVIGGSWARLPS